MLPSVSTERQTVVVLFSGGSGPNSDGYVASLTRDGWVVSRIDTMGNRPVVQLERPRYVGVIEDLQDRLRGTWCWLTTRDWYC
jgi:hypothetical protein